MLNSDINERNNRNSSLNLVFPGFMRETEGGGTYVWCEGNKIVECSAKFFKEVECVHSFKKALIDFYASFQFSLLYFYCLITSHSQLLIVLFAVVFLIVISSDYFMYIFNCDY